MFFVIELFSHQSIGEQSVARGDKPFVVRTFVDGVTRIVFAPARLGVVAQEIDRAELPIFVRLANNSANPSLVKRIGGMTIEREHQQAAVWGDEEAHP